jgi:UDP-2,3-diacylglucosamine hydrolase
MSHTLFISDLHLSQDHPRSTELFQTFAEKIAPGAEALYILGDLFEYWAGDDDLDDPFHQHICTTLRDLNARGTRIYIMHGNRDFLMDEELGYACDATLLDDPTLVDLYGTPTLLTHGDALCTDDVEYQRFRGMVRNMEWQQRFLSQPLATRRAQIEGMRAQSKDQKQVKAMSIMDVSNAAVDELLRQHNYPRLIHGHTHRPAKHMHEMNGRRCERWVLGDWDVQANAIRCDGNGVSWEVFSF